MPAKPEEPWMQPVAELMAREGITLKEAATRLKVPIGSEEAGLTFRSKLFQKILRSERNRFYAEVGSDSEWRRRTAIGMLLNCAKQLMEAGEYDKAADVVLKTARVEGWLGNEQQINVFAGLSQKDLDGMRAKLQEKAKQAAAN